MAELPWEGQSPQPSATWRPPRSQDFTVRALLGAGSGPSGAGGRGVRGGAACSLAGGKA